MVTRIRVVLDQPEYSGLLRIAEKELRNPSDQLRHILRLELRRRGLLPPPDQSSVSATEDQGAEEVSRD